MSSAECFNELVRGGKSWSCFSEFEGLADDALSAVTLMTTCCNSTGLVGIVATSGPLRGRPEFRAR